MGYKELDALIPKIQKLHLEISELWIHSNDYKRINFAKTCVIDVMESSKSEILLETIFKYRNFLCIEVLPFCLELSDYEFRVKNQNSIESKLAVYMHKGEECGKASLHGKIPLAKCLNDLFGVRYVFKNNEHSLQETYMHIRQRFPGLKVTDSSKQGYKAIHVYFKKDNLTFQWELQIWKQCDVANNKESHRKYKQDYTNWEEESIKEGE